MSANMTRATRTSMSVNPLRSGIGFDQHGGARPGIYREHVRAAVCPDLNAKRRAGSVVVERHRGEGLGLHERAAYEGRGARVRLGRVKVDREVVGARDGHRLLLGAVVQ